MATLNPMEPTTSPTACTHPEHNPPQLISRRIGGYSWSCPGCGYSFTFAVSGAALR
jgi:hypothetical protein